MTAEEKLAKARAWIIWHHPFYGGFLMTFKWKEDNNLTYKTMAVSSKEVLWDRGFVENTPMLELRAILLHEALHVALSHIARMQTYYKIDKWNIAADHAVNYYVTEFCNTVGNSHTGEKQCKLPDNALYDPKYADKSLEEIYKLLPTDEKALCPAGAFRDGHIPGAPEDNEDVVKRMVTVWESLSNDHKKQSIGTMPGELSEVIDSYKRHKINWRQFVRETTIDLLNKKDYTYMPRSYNYMAIDEDGFYPRLVGATNKIIVVVADTSGSVSNEWLQQFAGEMTGALELADRTILMTNDADVHEVEDASQFGDVLSMLKMRGRGGTDFRPPFEYLEKNKIVPEVLIFLTDGWGPFPEYDPGYPVVWGAIPGTAAEAEYPQWARSQVVVLEE